VNQKNKNILISDKENNNMDKIKRNVKQSGLNGIIIIFVAMFVFASIIFADKNFLSLVSINNLLKKACTDGGMLALGMTFVMLIGYIDLSVGAVLAMSGIFTAMACAVHPILGLVCGLMVGVVCGLLNGFIVTKMKISPFVATLATMLGLRGAILLITQKKGIRVTDEFFNSIANTTVFGISVTVFIMAALLILCIHIARNTRFGMALYAVGGNEEAARMMGLKVDRIKISAYVMCGLFAGIGGILLTSRLGAAQAVAGESWETTAIASAALGGIKLTGGEGKFLGTFFGILIIGIINMMFNYAGNINIWWQNIIMGLLLFGSVAAQSDIFRSFRKKKIKIQPLSE
jgi:ribose/xylose/arabinose/galactoside ABC-type transport system permease subunit